MAQERHPQILAAHVRPSVPVPARILGPSSARPRLSSSSSSTGEREEGGWVAPMNVLVAGTILLRMQLIISIVAPNVEYHANTRG